MATRHERVVLTLEDNFSANMAKAAASAKLLDRELDSIKGSSVAFTRSTTTLTADSQRAGASIDQLSGRLEILARAAAVIGPSFAPIASAAVPALAGLSTQLGFTVAGAGTAVLALQGVGDALEAVNKYQIEPSSKNLEKAEQAMEYLSIDGRRLVLTLDEMGPAFRAVREAAGAGLIPGVLRALDDVESLLPRVGRIVEVIGDATGDLLADGAKALAGPEWENFFNYVEVEARPVLTTLGQTIGNLTTGVAELWMAMDPFSDDFTSGLLNASEAFEDWARQLDETEGFQDFLAYVRDTGPQVLDTLGAFAGALIDIGTAAAPLGGPVLQALEAVAETISLIAESPLGPPIVAAVAAMSALNLATAAWAATSKTAWVANARGAKGYMGFMASAARATMLLKAGVAALAVEAGGAAAGFDATNTAMGIFAGAMLGGAPGAAIGAGAGLLLDLSKAGDGVTASIEDMNRSLSSGDADAFFENAEKVTAAYEDATTKTGILGNTDFLTDTLGEIGRSFDAVFRGDFLEDPNKEMEEAAEKAEAATRALNQFGDAMGTDVTTALRDSAPALNALGITMEEIAGMDADGVEGVVRAVALWTEISDSAPARTRALVDAFVDVDDSAVSTTDSVDALRESLDAILGPQLGLSEATDAWSGALDELKENLHQVENAQGEMVAGSREVFGQTEGARENREALRGLVSDLTDVVVAGAEAGESGEQLARRLAKGKEALLDQAEAAGLNRREVKKYVEQLNLTPELVETIINAVTDPAKQRLKDLKGLIDNIEGTKKDIFFRVVTKHIDVYGKSNAYTGGGPGRGNLEYAEGGYTGPGHKYQPAGIVHAGEFVLDAVSTARAGVDNLYALQRQLRGYADGGMVGRYGSAPMMRGTSAMAGAGIDYDRLADAVARNARPLYGDVSISGDPTVFRRQMQHDRALAGMDGVRRP